MNARESKIPYPWLVFNEKIKVNSVFLHDSTAVSDSVVLLFGGNISKDGVSLLFFFLIIYSHSYSIKCCNLKLPSNFCFYGVLHYFHSFSGRMVT